MRKVQLPPPMTYIEKIQVNVGKKSHITNVYLVYNEDKEGILIDPGYDAKKIMNEITERELDIKYIFLTHAHADHVGALAAIQKNIKAKIVIHELEEGMLLGAIDNCREMLGISRQKIDTKSILEVLNDQHIKVGKLDFEMIYTPGHTKGSICIYEKNSKALFTGDTIFCDCYGRCDLPTGSFKDMKKSLKNLFTAFSDITIYPGHGKEENIELVKKKVNMLLAFKGEKI